MEILEKTCFVAEFLTMCVSPLVVRHPCEDGNQFSLHRSRATPPTLCGKEVEVVGEVCS